MALLLLNCLETLSGQCGVPKPQGGVLQRCRRARNWLAVGVLLVGALYVRETFAGRQSSPPKNPTSAADKQTKSVATSGGDSDFQDRCSSPGVVKCVGFDSPADIAGKYGDPSGILPGDSTPVIDTTVKASGNGSLKFTIPANSSANSSGSYFTNFSDDLSVQFDSGREFYIQWRQRFSPEFISTQYAGGEGWKQVIISEGDRPGVRVPSCQPMELVVTNNYYRGFPQLYHSCGEKDRQYEPFVESIPPSYTDFYLQNAIRNPGCLYSLVNSGRPYIPPCVGYKANQWMTFQVRIKVGTWYTGNHVYKHDSIVQMWVAEEGKPSLLVIDFSPKGKACQEEQVSIPACQTGYDLVNTKSGVAKYGKIWLLPYNTGKNPSVRYPTAYTWYDELIISRQRIPDPKK